jgi:Dolichyl-phosphate-mannose-protein mannosyltransferase
LIFPKKISSNSWLLLVVIGTAALLRFWNFSSMQFMHDELSAIIRSQANSFSELIYKTKTTDVHPVGVPIFVHYWTLLVGTSVIMVRLPFILLGLVSIYYAYKIAEKWFNASVAIITAAFLASLQFSTMYGQLERPYATGMLFSVVMVWCWTQFFFGEKTKTKYAIGFVLFASLSTYNHYFSLLFAGLVGVTGLFFLNKEKAKKYIIMCAVVLLLFIPHISILLFHLSLGSGGEESWLVKPQSDWFLMFFKYLFHYSKGVYVLIFVLFFASFYFRNKEKKISDKMRIIAFIWALFVPCLAYVYSITKTPVLQFSTFTFSLPFLLMFVFSFYKELKTPVKIVVVASIILINTYTLFANRKHDPLFYKQPYQEMAIVGANTIKAFGEKKVSLCFATMEGFVDFYFNKNTPPFSYLRLDKQTVTEFSSYLEKEKTDYFVAGNLPLENIQLIQQHYPYIVSKEEGFTFSIYCFSKTKPAVEIKEKTVFSETQFQTHSSKGWDEIKTIEDTCYTGKQRMMVDSSKEYSAGFSSKLSSLIKNKHSILNVSAVIESDDETINPSVVIAIQDDKTNLLWRGRGYQEYKQAGKKKATVFVSNLFSGMDLTKHPNAVIKIYVWNRDKKQAFIYDFKIEVIESNPFIYGLYEPIK